MRTVPRGRGYSQNPQIGRHVRQLRQARAWSQKDLADKARIGSVDTIVRVEKGILVSQAVLEDLAQVFGLTLAQLIDYRDEVVCTP